MESKTSALIQVGQRLYCSQGPLAQQTKPAEGAKGPQFYFNFFDASFETPYWVPSEVFELNSNDIKEIPAFWEKPDSFEKSVISSQSFSDDFNQVKEWIGQGLIEKAVPVCFEKFSLAGAPRCVPDFRKAVFAQLCQSPTIESQWKYFFEWQADSWVAGISPELLFEIKLEGNTRVLRSFALAGTRRAPLAHEDQYAIEQEFLQDAKESAEHEYVRKDLVEKLKGFGECQVGARFVSKYSSLWHLKTPIECRLESSVEIDQLVKRLHPTPALGTYPSYEWARLSKLSGSQKRGPFGAPLGIIFPNGEALFVVAIRNLIAEGAELRVGSGCGVVAQSRVEKEWEELALKRQSVKQYFSLTVRPSDES